MGRVAKCDHENVVTHAHALTLPFVRSSAGGPHCVYLSSTRAAIEAARVAPGRQRGHDVEGA